jgi:carbon-monoxide dehydrogenase medium subunit
MKAPAFAYLKAESVDEAIAALAQHGDSAQVLAGGQSLMPLLNLRMAAPSVLVDITGLSELREIRIVGDRLRIGALTTHRQIQESARVRDHVPLLAQAVPHVAHMAIRNQGAIGGSLSLADPAAEYPVVALALQAVIELRGPKGVRRVNADDYFLGLYTDRAHGGRVAGGRRVPDRPGLASCALRRTVPASRRLRDDRPGCGR